MLQSLLVFGAEGGEKRMSRLVVLSSAFEGREVNDFLFVPRDEARRRGEDKGDARQGALANGYDVVDLCG